MGVCADTDLHRNLSKIIDALNKTADEGISLTPGMTRHVVDTIRTVRDCHKRLAEYEGPMVDGGNVVPIIRREEAAL